jgi:LEA14-like dessication related protein
MKNIGRKIPLVLFSACLVLFGCAALQQLVQKPVVTLKRTDLRNVSLSEGTLVFVFDVNNPNPIGVSAQKVSYRLQLNGKDFVQGVLDKGITVRANGVEPFELPVTVRFLEFFKSMQELFKSDQVAYVLDGALSLGIFDVPYSARGILPVPKLPEVSLSKVRVNRISLSGASLVFSLRMKNTNPFSVKPQALSYNIDLAGSRFAGGAARQLQAIQENGESVMELPLNVSFVELGRSAYSLLAGSSSKYEITGSINLDIPQAGLQAFPFSKSGELAIVK